VIEKLIINFAAIIKVLWMWTGIGIRDLM